MQVISESRAASCRHPREAEPHPQYDWISILIFAIEVPLYIPGIGCYYLASKTPNLPYSILAF